MLGAFDEIQKKRSLENQKIRVGTFWKEFVSSNTEN